MPWYYRVKAAINAAMPFLAPTQETDLALLVSAILKKQTLCLSDLARAYSTPKKRRVGAPKHDLLHRPKRLWRFTDNERVDASEVQLALVAHHRPSGLPPSVARKACLWGAPETGHKVSGASPVCPKPAKGRETPQGPQGGQPFGGVTTFPGQPLIGDHHLSQA
jgi:hypothetical protein